MKLTTRQKTLVSAVSIALGLAIVFIAFEYVPKIMGKLFLIGFAFLIVKFVNDFIKHERNN